MLSSQILFAEMEGAVIVIVHATKRELDNTKTIARIFLKQVLAKVCSHLFPLFNSVQIETTLNSIKHGTFLKSNQSNIFVLITIFMNCADGI